MAGKNINFSKKTSFLIVLITLGIIISIFFLNPYGKEKTLKKDLLKNQEIKETKMTKPKSLGEDHNISYKEIYEKEFNECITHPSNGDAYQCLAWTTDNLILCNKWIDLEKDIEEKNSCIDGHLIFKKILLDKEYPCEQATREDIKLLCQALKKRDIDYCDKIEKKDERNMCISLVTGSQSCSNLIGEGKECKDTFEFYLAIKEKNTSKCDLITDKQHPLTCKALTKGDKQICNQENAELCKIKAKIEVKEIMKGKEEEKKEEKDDKNFDIGSNKRNMSFCKKIINKDLKNTCISVVNDDLELCKQVKDEDNKFSCMIQIAEIRGEYEKMCTLLKNKDKEIECIKYFEDF